MNYKYLLLIFSLIFLLQNLCFYCFKLSRKTGKQLFVYLGIIGFATIGYLFYSVTHDQKFPGFNITLQGISLVIALLIGYFLHEKRWSTGKTLALSLAGLSLYIMYLEENIDDKLGANN